MKSTNPKTAPLPGAPPQPASAPIDISKARPKARAAKLPSPAGPTPAANPRSGTETQPSFTLRQRRFLQLLREGNNITMAAAILGITRHGYSQWRRRAEGFRAAVAAAREVHRQEIACAFHDADAYARSLLDRVQRDQSLPAALRLRAANHLLRRPGLTDWLPATLPEDLDPDDSSDDSPTELPGFPDFAGEILPRPARASRETNPAGPSRDERSTQSESAQAAAQCGNGQSQSATAAHGSLPNQPPAPRTVAQSIQPSALHAYIHQVRSETRNYPPNQQHPVIPPSPAPASQTENHAYNAYTQPGATKLTPGNGSPCPGLPPSLTETWLNPAFLHKHEKPKAFESLLNNYMRTYAPANAPEELLVFRITQKAWLLRRVEIWERVVADSRIAKVREKHPNAAAPACIALALLEAKETGETRFYQRTSKLRQEHEDALDRLTARLDTLQLRRDAATRREERRPFAHQQLAASETAFPSPS